MRYGGATQWNGGAAKFRDRYDHIMVPLRREMTQLSDTIENTCPQNDGVCVEG